MLTLKRIGIDTHRESIAYLSRHCAGYHAEEFLAFGKIELRANGIRISATLNIVDDEALLGPQEIGLSEEAFRLFGQPAGTSVSIEHPRAVESLDAVRAKIQGQVLDETAYAAVIRDIAARRYSKMEIAAFLVGCASFMTVEEVLALTRAMAGTGQRLHWGGKMVVDKHCIGGI
ncbi:MAG: thymidine phosphorylase, partial [Ferrovibrio sp.]